MITKFEELSFTAQRYYILYSEGRVNVTGLNKAVTLKLISQAECDYILKEVKNNE